jgi:hypothetical protein
MNTENRNSRHLTEKEISQWLVEGPEHSAGQHVRDCWTCQAKLAEAQAPLAAFRRALVEWSEVQTPQSMNLQTPVVRNERLWGRRLWLPAVSFALAALLLVGYAKIPGSLRGNSTGQPPVATASATTDSDEALLNQVDTEVSEAVPDAMAPLTDLVSWDASEGSATHAPTTEKHLGRKTSTKPAIAKAPIDVKN